MRRLSSAVATGALLVLNVWMVARLFHTEYTVEMGSIEAGYISLAHYILHHFSWFTAGTWFPLWYGGIPSPDSYPPLLHLFNAAIAAILRISPALAYHGVCATVFAGTPVILFWTMRRLGAGVMGAFIGGLCYSLICASCILIPEIRNDTVGWLGPRRIENLANYGEGTLQFAFLFLLLSVGLIHLALERRRSAYFFAAGLAIAAVALSNWISAFALGLTLAAYLLSGLGGAGLFRWVATAATGVFAYALAMPWTTPSIVATIRANAPRMVGFQFSNRARWVAVIAVAAIAIIAWLTARWRIQPRLRFSILFAIVSATIPLASFWWKIDLLPQAWRYHVLMDLALCVSIGLALPVKFGRIPAAVTATVLIALAIPAAIHERAIGRIWTKPLKIETTVQFEVASWLEANMPGQRVFGPGSIGFWMDAFSDTPMLTGGFDNGIRNLFVPGVNYQIYAGESQELSVAWMKAFGVDAVIANEKGSREYFNSYRFPEKFKGMKELWRDGGDVIYSVPRGTTSLAHAMRESDTVKMIPVAYNQVAIEPYLRALDDPAFPAVDFRWRDPSTAEMTSDLRPEHIVSVQVAWDEGWHARVNGRPRSVQCDKLGQIEIAPACSGVCHIELTHDGTTVDQFAAIISPVAFLLGGAWAIFDLLRPRKRRLSRLPAC